MTAAADGQGDLTETLARAYYEPLGWDMDDLDPDDLRDCMKAMEPVADAVERILRDRIADERFTLSAVRKSALAFKRQAERAESYAREVVAERDALAARPADEDGLRADRRAVTREVERQLLRLEQHNLNPTEGYATWAILVSDIPRAMAAARAVLAAHPEHRRTGDWRVVSCTCGWSAPGEDYTAFDRHLAHPEPTTPTAEAGR